MEKIKRVITILVISLIIICIILAVIAKKNNKNESEKIDPPFDDSQFIVTPNYESKIEIVNTRNEYYIVKSNVKKYYSYYSNMFTQTRENGYSDEMQKSAKSELYNLLDSEYIDTEGITKENINLKLKKIEDSVVNITRMYVSRQNKSISTYVVEGTLRQKNNSAISNFTVIVRIDDSNNTFSILPSEYVIDKYKELKLGEKLNISNIERIEDKKDNDFVFKQITDEQYVQDLIEQYKEEILYNSELVYKKLDTEYKAKRFDSLEKFKEYAKNNFRNNFIIKASQYQKNVEDGYTQYICIDQNNNYYIFNEKTVMDYSLILDTYTIDLPEFIDTYNKSTDQNKAKLNLEKIQEALNKKDYKYIYSKLNSTFKANNFKEESQFESYIKNNFFEKNKISYTTAEKQGDAWLFNAKLSNANGTEQKGINLVIKLNEGTNFEMSFSMK